MKVESGQNHHSSGDVKGAIHINHHEDGNRINKISLMGSTPSKSNAVSFGQQHHKKVNSNYPTVVGAMRGNPYEKKSSPKAQSQQSTPTATTRTTASSTRPKSPNVNQRQPSPSAAPSRTKNIHANRAKSPNARTNGMNDNSAGLGFFARYLCYSCVVEQHQEKMKNHLDLQTGTSTTRTGNINDNNTTSSKGKSNKLAPPLSSESKIDSQFYGYDVNSPESRDKSPNRHNRDEYHSGNLHASSGDPTIGSLTRSSSFQSDHNVKGPLRQINLSDVEEASRFLEEQRERGEDDPDLKVENLFESIDRQQYGDQWRNSRRYDEESEESEEEDEDDETIDDDKTDPENSINTDSLPSGNDDDDEDAVRVLQNPGEADMSAAIAVAIPDDEVPDSSASFVRLTPIGTMSANGTGVVYVAESELPSIYSGLNNSRNSNSSIYAQNNSSPSHYLSHGGSAFAPPSHSHAHHNVGLGPAAATQYDSTPYIPQSQPYLNGSVPISQNPSSSANLRRSPGATSIYSNASSHHSAPAFPIPPPIMIPTVETTINPSPRNLQAAFQNSIYSNNVMNVPVPCPLSTQATPVYPPGSIYSPLGSLYPMQQNTGSYGNSYVVPQPPSHIYPNEQMRQRQDQDNVERAIQESLTLATYRAQQPDISAFERELERVDEELLNKALQDSLNDFVQKSQNDEQQHLDRIPPPVPPRPNMFVASPVAAAPTNMPSNPSPSNRTQIQRDRERSDLINNNSAGSGSNLLPPTRASSVKNLVSFYNSNVQLHQSQGTIGIRNGLSRHESNLSSTSNVSGASAFGTGSNNSSHYAIKRSPKNGEVNNSSNGLPTPRRYPESSHQAQQKHFSPDLTGHNAQKVVPQVQPSTQLKQLKRVNSDETISSKGSLLDGNRQNQNKYDRVADGTNGSSSSSSSMKSSSGAVYRTLSGDVIIEGANQVLASLTSNPTTRPKSPGGMVVPSNTSRQLR